MHKHLPNRMACFSVWRDTGGACFKNKPLNFYAGILSVSLYIYVFYTVELYAESLLNGYYLIVSIAGIFLWSKKKKKKLTHYPYKEARMD